VDHHVLQAWLSHHECLYLAERAGLAEGGISAPVEDIYADRAFHQCLARVLIGAPWRQRIMWPGEPVRQGTAGPRRT
jgi:hypothetical protein